MYNTRHKFTFTDVAQIQNVAPNVCIGMHALWFEAPKLTQAHSTAFRRCGHLALSSSRQAYHPADLKSRAIDHEHRTPHFEFSAKPVFS